VEAETGRRRKIKAVIKIISRLPAETGHIARTIARTMSSVLMVHRGRF
jgi:hypothetical protein